MTATEIAMLLAVMERIEAKLDVIIARAYDSAESEGK